MTIGQSGVGTQVTDGFVNMAYAVLVAIGLVYLLRMPVVILFALPLVAISAFAALAVAGRQRDLSALIGLLMLIDIVDINATVLLNLAVATNAIVLREIAQHKIETGAGVRGAAAGRAHPREPRPDDRRGDDPGPDAARQGRTMRSTHTIPAQEHRAVMDEDVMLRHRQLQGATRPATSAPALPTRNASHGRGAGSPGRCTRHAPTTGVFSAR